MKKIILIVFLFFPLFFNISCTTSTEPSDSIEGLYKFVSYYSNGKIYAEGIIVLSVGNKQKVSGNWEFDNGDSGKLEGELNGVDLVLNLNPDFVDNNLFLLGSVEQNIIKGDWEFVGFPGVMHRGSFVAVKI